MLILLSIAAVGNCQNLQKAGETDVGVLYVDVDSVQSLSKSGQLYLAVFGGAVHRRRFSEFAARGRIAAKRRRCHVFVSFQQQRYGIYQGSTLYY